MNASMMYDLDRFLAPQATTYARALSEIARGRKTSHWMWFAFPQLAGLGRSEMARGFAIGSLDEARVYLAIPSLANATSKASPPCRTCRPRMRSASLGRSMP